MASVTKVAKRIPLIKFPNRKAGDAHTSKAVAVSQASGGESSQASGGESSQALPSFGSSHAMPSLPSGTASSQPPRTKLSVSEIEAILLGGAAP